MSLRKGDQRQNISKYLKHKTKTCSLGNTLSFGTDTVSVTISKDRVIEKVAFHQVWGQRSFEQVTVTVIVPGYGVFQKNAG